MRDGVYRLYRYEMGDPSGQYLRLVARFIIHGKEIVVLEDHIHMLGDIIGSVLDRSTLRALAELHTSGYYRLENEDDIAAGEYLDQVDDAPVEEPTPDSKFEATVPGAPAPLMVEVYGDSLVVEGQPLSPEEAQALMEQIEAGQVQVSEIPLQKKEEEPKPTISSLLVDSKRDIVTPFGVKPDEHELIHGVDLAETSSTDLQPDSFGSWGEGATGVPRWGRSATGRKSIIKESRLGRADADSRDHYRLGPYFEGGTASFREAAFHRLASDVFGLGDHVPVTTAFAHPTEREHILSAQELIQHGHHDVFARLDDNSQGGVPARLALMDYILGHIDRHPGNYLFDRDGKLYLIDNGIAFVDERIPRPAYFYTQQTEIPGAIQDYLMSIDDDRISQFLSTVPTISEEEIEAVKWRLHAARNAGTYRELWSDW